MKNLLTSEELIAFEDDIANEFNSAKIKSPVHLYNDNEEKIIQVFKSVEEDDYIVCSWRSHYQCLLKGVPKEELKQAILDNRSISLCFKKQKIISSAIVGGNIPIALGIALDIKRRNDPNRVWCFVGDMTSTTGAFHEAYKYAKNHDLPIIFVVEDNGKSVCTITKEAWNQDNNFDYICQLADMHLDEKNVYKSDKLWYYTYKLTKYEHAGTGRRIQF